MKILAIIRSSSEKQETESQKKEIIQFCLDKGYKEENIKVIEVAGASARKLNDKYLQMLDSIKSTIINEGFKCCAIWHLNRLGRNEAKLIEMKEFFKQNKIQVYVKYPSFQLFQDNGNVDEGGNLFWSMLSVCIEKDTEEMFAKMKRGKKRNSEQGRYSGGKIKFGYDVDENGFYTIHQEEASIVRLIYELYSSGKYSVLMLSRELNQRGIKLDRHQVQVILKHTAYIGYNEHNGILRTYPRIVSDELFNQCRKISDSNKNSITKTERQDFALKLIKCPHCGYYYSHQMYSKSKGKIGGIYSCWNHAIEKKCDNRLSISSYNLDRLLWFVAKDAHIKYLMSIDDGKIEEYKEQIKLINQKIDVVKSKIEKIEGKKRKVAINYENDIYTEEQYYERLKEINDEVNEHSKLLIQFNEDIEKLNNLIKSIEDKQHPFSKFINSVESIKLNIKEVKLNSLTSSITLIEIIKMNGESIEIKYYSRTKNEVRKGWLDRYYMNDISISEQVYKRTYEYDYILDNKK